MCLSRLLFICLLLNINHLFGQAKQWDKTVGSVAEENLIKSFPTADGGVIMIGMSGSYTSGDKTVGQKLDTREIWMVKLNASGQKLWDKILTRDQATTVGAGTITRDGYLALVATKVIISPKNEVVAWGVNFIKIDDNGNIVVNNFINDKRYLDPSAICETKDGGFVLVARINVGDVLPGYGRPQVDPILVKVNSGGGKLWSRTYGNKFDDGIGKIIADDKDDLVAVGWTTNTTNFWHDGWMFKTDASGNLKWEKFYPGGSINYLGDVIAAGKDGYFVNGRLKGYNEIRKVSSDCWLAKIGPAGDIIYEIGNTGVFGSMLLAPDGGLLLASSAEGGKGRLDYRLQKFNGSGNLLWSKFFGGNYDDQVKDLSWMSDGSVLLSGESISAQSGDKSEPNRSTWIPPYLDYSTRPPDFWAVKLAPWEMVVKPDNLPDMLTTATAAMQLKSTGGLAPYIYRVVVGQLPPGLSLASDGKITGKPTQAGTYTFSVNAQDIQGTIATKQYVIKVSKADQQLLTEQLPAFIARTNIKLPDVSDAGLPLSYQIVKGHASVLSGNLFYAYSGGTVTLRISQSGNNIYNAASQEFTFCAYPKKPAVYKTIRDEKWTLGYSGSLSDQPQWFLDGKPIPGATQITYAPVKNGAYSVEIRGDVCTTVSDPFEVKLEPEVALLIPQPDNLNADGTFIYNPKLYEKNAPALGIAADGAARLLIISDSQATLTFSMKTEDGSLMNFSGNWTYTLPLRRSLFDQMIGLVYVPPVSVKDLPVTGRKISIKVTNDNGYEKVLEFMLYPPPVVLVHGMWSDPTAWNSLAATLSAKGYKTVKRADYSADNEKTFDPASDESLPGRSAIQYAINDALKDYRDKGIYAARVDVVAHSLGGLMTRSLASQEIFTNKSNFRKGYINKLITIGTPHAGSPLGPLLYDHRDDIAQGKTLGYASLAYLMFYKGISIGTAQRDFNPLIRDKSPLYRLGDTKNMRVHAIVGNWQPVKPPLYQGINALTYAIDGKLLKEFMGTDNTDVIVTTASQSGGLTAAATTTIGQVSHTEETSNAQIQAKVLELLSDKDDRFAAGFSRPVTTIPNNTRAQITAAAGQDPVVNDHYVQFRSSELTGANKRTLKLVYEPLNGAQPVSAFYLIGGLGFIEAPAQAPYSTTIELPGNMPVGQIPLTLVARDKSGVLMADTSHVNSGSMPDNNFFLSVFPSEIRLDSTIRQQSLTAYADKENSLPIAAGALTYQLKTASGIVSVDNNGSVKALRPGNDTLRVSYLGKTAKVPVSVAADFAAIQRKQNVIQAAAIPDKTETDVPFALTAVSSSGNPVTFAIQSGPATIRNGILSLTGPGTVVVRFTAAQTAYFEAAKDVLISFCVKPALPVIGGAKLTCLSAQRYSVASRSGLQYTWKLSGGGELSPKGASVDVKWKSTGKYLLTVIPRTPDGCEGAAATYAVEVVEPKVTVRTLDDRTTFRTGDSLILIADQTTGVQWFKDGARLAGATGQRLVVKAGGTYYASYELGSGCQVNSNMITANKIFALPNNNFTVRVTGATCRGQSNGAIQVSAIAAEDYVVTLTQAALQQTYNFSRELNIAGLKAGRYDLCITVKGQPDFNQCFSLTVQEPQDLALLSIQNNANNTITLRMSGAKRYLITINEQQYSANRDTVTLPLSQVVNKLMIASDLPCQGAIERVVINEKGIVPFPNPFTNELRFNIGNERLPDVRAGIFAMDDGKLIEEKEYHNASGILTFPLSLTKTGLYILKLTINDKTLFYKVIKK